MTISDKAVLVTGANRGIGQAAPATWPAPSFDGVDSGDEEIFPDTGPPSS